MSEPTLKDKVYEAIFDEFRYDFELADVKIEITDNIRLKEDLKMDEIDRIQLPMAMEECFNIEITDEESMEWNTALDVFKTVEEKMAE